MISYNHDAYGKRYIRSKTIALENCVEPQHCYLINATIEVSKMIGCSERSCVGKCLWETFIYWVRSGWKFGMSNTNAEKHTF